MASSSSQLRLMSDLKSIINEPPEGCSASPLSDENLFVWSATIFGPDETPWEGGVFGLRLTFGDSYPEKPPRVRFTCEIFHPNGVVPEQYMLKNSKDMFSCLAECPFLGFFASVPRYKCDCSILKLVKVHNVANRPRTYPSSEYAILTVYQDGTLCMDIIQDAWSPCHNVCTILTSVQSLLTDPNPASPANPEAAQMYQHDIQSYNRRVRRCARRSIES
ncbi:hypothetical protein C5167_037422 [Papaver somniferum]|uniref:UBC core domain-containing protein n=1 Tax=Papaver somniferum TaxID=3469 RepID=A0A4Y7I8U0_PAPSO|nr:hypothetical protein C5167_037422 [Papaver somniferum]